MRDELLSHSITLRPSYPIWIEAHDTLNDQARQDWRDHLARLDPNPDRPPLITFAMVVADPGSPDLARAVGSLIRQVDPGWQLRVVGERSMVGAEAVRALAAGDGRIGIVAVDRVDEATAWNAALADAGGRFVAMMDAGDELAEDALAWLRAESTARPDALAIFSDEDELDGEGRRHSPRFKPGWNRELFLTTHHVGRLLAIRAEAFRTLGGFAADPEGSPEFDLLLRLIETSPPGSVRHVPRVLYHRRSSRPGASASALRRHFERTGSAVEVVEGGDDGPRLVYPLDPAEVMVSVIIATRDRKALLETVVEGLLHGTDYPSLEILVVDNDSVEPETLAYFAQIQGDPRVKVIPSPGPFNYSALNNLGASQAKGRVLALLNNDLKVIEAGWLREVVSHAIRPEVGAVGAKLYYADDRIQHAGIVVGMQGIAGHVHKMLPRDQPGYLEMARHAQEFSAVTGACLVCRAEVYREAGGLDEANLAVSFNDIDFCLKVVELGYRVIFTPRAELYHLESASRGSDYAGAKLERFLREIDHMNRTWKARLDADPYFNPNLDRLSDQYTLAFPPRVRRPWED